MLSRRVSLTAFALFTGLALCSAALAAANPGTTDGLSPTAQSAMPQFSNGPGGPIHYGSPRGGGDIIHSGIPACDDMGVCDLQVGVTGVGAQNCPTGSTQWVSLAFPVETNGATITAVNMTHNTNSAGGHLYLLGDCGGNPDIGNRLYTGCDDIVAGNTGPQVYPIDPPVVTGATTWVVAVFDTSFSFDVAYNSSLPGTGLAYGNLSGSGACGEWDDLDVFGFGFCYCVSVTTGESLPACCEGALCDGDANGDGVVDPLDSGFVLSRFGLDPTVGDNCTADTNCDGVIDPLDSGYVLSRFGTCNEPILCAPGGGDCGPGGGGELENDNCEDALTATEGVTPFSNVDATTDGPADCDEFTGNFDIWYNYTASATGTVVVSLCGNTFFDSTLSVYSGFGCPVGAPLACSDDDCGTIGGPSEVSVPVTNGQQLKIRIGGWDDGSGDAFPKGTGEMTISFVPSGQGACCFEDESCTLDTSAGCTGAGGTFQGEGTNCSPTLCLIGPPNDNCEDVAPVVVPTDGTVVTFMGDNTSATNDCAALGQPEVWEAFSIDEQIDVHIDYCGSSPTHSPAYIVLDAECPCSGAFVFADVFAFDVCPEGDTNIQMTFEALPAGDYWLPVYSDPIDGTIGPYTINVSASFPPADCCAPHPQPGCDEVCGTPVGSEIEDCVCAIDPVCCEVGWDEACVEEVEFFGCGDCSVCEPPAPPVNDNCADVDVDVVGIGDTVNWTGTVEGATETCAALGFPDGEVWHAFQLTETANVKLDHCGTSPVWGNAFIVIDDSCPCDGDFIFATSFENTSCDGNWNIYYDNLPAGTYYTPIINDPGLNPGDEYSWNLTVTAPFNGGSNEPKVTDRVTASE